MSEIRDDVRYTENHEWVQLDGTTAKVGITDYAQDSLGEIVYVELPEVEDQFSQGDEVASIESVKAAAPVYAPMGGRIVRVNKKLEDSPELLNEAPFKNPIYTLEVDDPDEYAELMDSDAYADFLKERE